MCNHAVNNTSLSNNSDDNSPKIYDPYSNFDIEPEEADLKPNIYRFRHRDCQCNFCQDKEFWQEVENVLIPLYYHDCYHEPDPYPCCSECLKEEEAIQEIGTKYDLLRNQVKEDIESF